MREDDRSSWENILFIKARPFLHGDGNDVLDEDDAGSGDYVLDEDDHGDGYDVLDDDLEGYLRLPAVASILSNFQPTF